MNKLITCTIFQIMLKLRRMAITVRVVLTIIMPEVVTSRGFVMAFSLMEPGKSITAVYHRAYRNN